MAHLSYRDPSGAKTRREVAGEVVIGRLPTCDVVLTSAFASRRHARVSRKDGTYWVEDLQSSRGTKVNGQRITRHELRNGDRIEIGGVELAFVAEPAPRPLSTSFEDTQSILTERSIGEMDLLKTVSMESGGPPGRSSDPALVALVRASARLRECTDVESIARTTLEMAQSATRADRGVMVRLVDDEEVEIARTTDEGLVPSRTFVGRILEQGMGMLALDTSMDAELALAQSVVGQGLRSILGAPLWDGERVVGFLYLDRSAGTFRTQDIDLLTVLGHQAAAEIARIELMDRVQREAEERRSLLRFLPPDVVARMDAGGAGGDFLEAQERVITVLHADVDGLGPLTAQLGAHKLKAFLDEHRERMMRIVVDDTGGTLDTYLGAGLRALFGAPVARGEAEDAVAALKAALAMRDEVEEARRTDRRYATLRLRIGVHSGNVVVGMMGSPRRAEYSVIGGVVQVAANLAGVALPGRVLTSGTTSRHLLTAGFQCVPAMDRSVEGEDGPEACWWVVGA